MRSGITDNQLSNEVSIALTSCRLSHRLWSFDPVTMPLRTKWTNSAVLIRPEGSLAVFEQMHAIVGGLSTSAILAKQLDHDGDKTSE
jgi:hypothetical protein